MATSPERPKAAKRAPATAAKATKKNAKAAAQKAAPTKPAAASSKAAASLGAKKPATVGKPKTPAKASPKAPATKASKATPPKGAPNTMAEAKKKAASATRSRYWAGAQRRARKLLRSKDQLLAIARQGEKVADKIKSGPMSRVIDDLKAMLRLIRAYATREYTGVSWESMVLVVAAVLYVVSPVDVIPDFIPAVGFLDDVTVVSFALKIVREELDEFRAWERETGRKARRSPR
jgi:uncharacterized membrane protein YkvA (DUF1232 family)